ncbi:Formate dehydrogenase subunit A [Vibrio nigripulchritudo SFn27]|uniref:Formate dehydrogenase subunit A n=1 Tax=Vibrio nigripulchritudo TaxID=28173 RepID=U4KFH1_9VIBR|nr:formate dehydrogenase subunit alpha [Vibrio nigripulchritudo]CCN84169.1 Formate dehydrogenase subunit A [Vibrio nigripulchritudo BLFn1]CCN87084.1 Formate dehydrogenase subunit A [Vibrio nigripulchritudo SFn27]CCN93211.1 Formate dehydrogenase subunit A [Vibrio nigripulchritudo ENn2]CCO39636.1 Formate dehydrogenase subunit A [Vibrio nigripulchritudo SFn135]CCO54341.1 Formate dehydrogenase subunit A [Vibrio nigripulchritudo Wn13]
MKLTKRSDSVNKEECQIGLSRRSFMKNSTLAAGGAAVGASMFAPGMMRKAEAKSVSANTPVEIKRTICSHCSVGCGIYAEVQNGVWTGQEPAFDHPFNAGGHCAKGAALREHGHGERRLKYPMKLEGGKWKQLSWDQAIEEIGNKTLEIRKESGPDSVYFLGSAKHNNEQAYMFRKMASLWGTNNVDHQARICHSTTVAGVANTWGYGAMTNSFNDMHNCKSMLFIGSNPAEAHPVAMQHILIAKEKNNCKIVVADPRRTRTAAKADHFVSIRPGSDVAFIWGILWHVFKNNWEDKEFIRQRVFGMDEIKEEVARWTPAEVERVAGVNEAEVYRTAKLLSENRPGCVVWCMGGTQHTTGNNNTRAYCVLELALGNIGKSGGGANIFRGHDNVQGATDLGVLSHTLPGYYGLSDGAWKHWSKVWEVDFEWVQNRFDQNKYRDKKPMNNMGIPVSRWIDGVLENKDNIEQKDNIRAMFYWGHAVNSQSRGVEMKKAMEKLDMMVIVDPYPTVAAVMNDRKDGIYLLPATTQFETYGSVTASNRSLQWRDKVVEPLFESKPDHEIMYLLSKKLGFSDQLFKNVKVENNQPLIEDITREFNRGMWTIGYTGQSPERLKEHQQNWHTFHKTSLEAEGGPAHGETYGLPWPCWGTPEMKHPGTHILYNTSKPVAEGGGNFRARFGVEFEGKNLLAVDSYSKGCELEDGYPEFNDKLLKALGWWNDLTEAEKTAAEGKNWKTDLSGGIQRVAIKHGCIPFGNAKARAVVWTFPDRVPLHREPLYTPRRDLVADYPTWDDRESIYRLPTLYKSIQDQDKSGEYPIILTSGRLVEYEGGGEETRSNPWLAELQQEMFVEVNPKDANDLGFRDGDMVWVEGAEKGRIHVKAMVTRRVKPGMAFVPFHFGGKFQGKDLQDKYPEGTDPYVLGEAANTATTYGYDPVTQMQETKVTLCNIRKA